MPPCLTAASIRDNLCVFLYNKSLNELGTNFQLVGYRYSTRGFYSLADTAWRRMSGYSVISEDGIVNIKPKLTDYYNLNYSKRGRLQATVTQQVGRTSTIYLTGSHQSYWNTSRSDEQLQIGYNSTIQDISWSLSYSLSKNAWSDDKDQLLAFNINIPFSHWMRSDTRSVFRNANASYNTSTDFKGRTTNTAGLYGTLLEDNNLSYSVQSGYNSGGNGNSGATGNAALNYRGAYGNANVGYSHSGDYKQVYYGVSGGVLAHENGITFSQPLNDTMVLIKAPGAKHVSVENQTGGAYRLAWLCRAPLCDGLPRESDILEHEYTGEQRRTGGTGIKRRSYTGSRRACGLQGQSRTEGSYDIDKQRKASPVWLCSLLRRWSVRQHRGRWRASLPYRPCAKRYRQREVGQ